MMTEADILATPLRTTRERRSIRDGDDAGIHTVSSRALSLNQLELKGTRETQLVLYRPNFSPFVRPSLRRIVDNARAVGMTLSPNLCKKKLLEQERGGNVGLNDGSRPNGSVPCLRGDDILSYEDQKTDLLSLNRDDENENGFGMDVNGKWASSQGPATPKRIPPPLLIPKPPPLRQPPSDFPSGDAAIPRKPVLFQPSSPSVHPDSCSMARPPENTSIAEKPFLSGDHPATELDDGRGEKLCRSSENTASSRSKENVISCTGQSAERNQTSSRITSAPITTSFYSVTRLSIASSSNNTSPLTSKFHPPISVVSPSRIISTPVTSLFHPPLSNSSSTPINSGPLTSASNSVTHHPSVANTRPVESVAFVCPASHKIHTQLLPPMRSSSDFSVLPVAKAAGAANGGDATAASGPLVAPGTRQSVPIYPVSRCCLSYCSYLLALPHAICALWGKQGVNDDATIGGDATSAVVNRYLSGSVVGTDARTSSGTRLCKLDYTCPCMPTTQTAIPEQEVPSPFLCWWGILLLFLLCFVGPFVYLSLLQSI